VGYAVAMRVHIALDDDLIAELDGRVGAGKRSSFIAGAVRRALDDERRWELIEGSLGSIEAEGHEWDLDPGGWVRAQRRIDADRVG